MGTGITTGLQHLEKLTGAMSPTERMPVLFVGHGNPMNAIETNSFSQTWKQLGSELTRPRAILSISAHWVTPGATKVTAMENPRTIHDFGGFPDELFAQQYPSPGSPEIARETSSAITLRHVSEDHDWGLDHGTWSVLLQMYPEAKIPVIQLSIDYAKEPEFHYQLGRELSKLRHKGVMILGTGNMVHNLRRMRWGETKPYDWAVEFDEVISAAIAKGDYKKAVDFQQMGSVAQLAHPTTEHYLPMLYPLGALEKEEKLEFFNEAFDMASVSMKSFVGSK